MPERRRTPFPWGLAAGNLLSLALGLAVAAGNFWKSRQGARAEVSALLALPSAPAYGALTLGVAAAAAASLMALVRRRPAGHRAYRLLPIAAALVIFAHGFVLPPFEPPLPSNEIALAQLAMGRDALSAEPALPAEPGPVEEAFHDMRPPYLVRGAAVPRWTVLTRRDCDGPWLEPPAGVRAGTLLYCLAPAANEAWMTAVGAGPEQFGEPSVIKVGGQPQVAWLKPSPMSAPQPPSPPELGEAKPPAAPRSEAAP